MQTELHKGLFVVIVYIIQYTHSNASCRHVIISKA